MVRSIIENLLHLHLIPGAHAVRRHTHTHTFVVSEPERTHTHSAHARGFQLSDTRARVLAVGMARKCARTPIAGDSARARFHRPRCSSQREQRRAWARAPFNQGLLRRKVDLRVVSACVRASLVRPLRTRIEREEMEYRCGAIRRKKMCDPTPTTASAIRI